MDLGVWNADRIYPGTGISGTVYAGHQGKTTDICNAADILRAGTVFRIRPHGTQYHGTDDAGPGCVYSRFLRKRIYTGKISLWNDRGSACDKYPSTLANSLRFIFEHVKAGREAVSQTAGDMAARDIRTHLARIYPLSVIASLAPLIGLLGTVVGMIEAFGLVALYGDEGGASILSDSISKALITTAAGLIIAAPAIALYFIIKNRIMRMASLVEVKVEEVITKLYLDNKEEKNETEL